MGWKESLSGGRREQNARPTINSYMYGNAKALSAIAASKADNAMSTLYRTGGYFETADRQQAMGGMPTARIF